MIKLLLASGARPDMKLAIDLKQLDLARQMLDRDASLARMRFGTGVTLLHDSTRVGDSRLGAIQLLLEFRGRVNATTNWGATPLHLAAFHGNSRTIRLLLENGADANAQDKHGRTPQMLAQGKGHAACAELLGNGTINTSSGDERRPVSSNADEADLIDAAFAAFSENRDDEPHPLDDFDVNFGIWTDDE